MDFFLRNHENPNIPIQIFFMHGILFCLVGISGVGKTTARKQLISQLPNIKYLTSYTTRLPRTDEIPGVDYNFILKQEFEKLISEDAFIEYEQHFDNYYGILKNELYANLKLNVSMIKEIASDGYLKILENIESKNRVYSVYILPENIDHVVSRLNFRGDLDIDLRQLTFEKELASKDVCDSIVISKDGQIDKLVDEIKKIIENVRKT